MKLRVKLKWKSLLEKRKYSQREYSKEHKKCSFLGSPKERVQRPISEKNKKNISESRKKTLQRPRKGLSEARRSEY